MFLVSDTSHVIQIQKKLNREQAAVVFSLPFTFLAYDALNDVGRERRQNEELRRLSQANKSVALA